MRRLGKLVGLVGIALLLLYLAAAWVLPGPLEARFNRVEQAGPYPVPESVREFHDRLLIADLHADSLLWDRSLLRRSAHGHVDLPRLQEANVALQAMTLVSKSPRGQNIDRNAADSDRITSLAIASGWPPRTWNSLLERALYQIENLQQAAQDSAGQLRILRYQDDLDDFLAAREQQEKLVATWIGIEGAHPLEGELDNIDRLFDAGMRMAGITHFFDNALGGSRHGLSQAGLTDFGRKAVRRMQDRGILIDLAHASDAVIADVLAMSRKPLVVSHTGVKGQCLNNRNLSDEQLRAIAATGGVIGIGFWPLAVCGDDVNAIIEAIRYTVDLIGVEHVALGSDFDGSVKTPFDVTGLPLITEGLLAAGFSAQDIALIMGGNTLRLLRQSLPRQAAR